MPFGCVGFDASWTNCATRCSGATCLQCLSAVWALMPPTRLHRRRNPGSLSPMPFGCVGFDANVRSRMKSKTLDRLSPMPFGCVGFDALLTRNRSRTSPGRSPMPFGCVGFDAMTSTQRVEAAAALVSPMPFGCVGFDANPATLKPKNKHTSLQCLSAVWALMPRRLLRGAYLLPGGSPMPFGCVGFDAWISAAACSACGSPSPMPFGCVGFDAVAEIDEATRLADESPMPFGCVGFDAHHEERPYHQTPQPVSNAFRLCGL